jgi:uncharacterized protein YunC (DUF1805 family)
MKKQNKKCPFHPIDISDDREVVDCDKLNFKWQADKKGYFLVKIEKGLIHCGFVNFKHKMIIEFIGKDPDKIIKEIAERKLCNLANMGYIASELMIARYSIKNRKKYTQR